MMIDWTKPIVLQLPTGETIPARPAGLDFDGKGKGNIRVNFFTTRFLSPISKVQFGPDDLGIDQEDVEELTGQSRYGQVVNVATDILPDWIDPATGKVIMVSELEARRREQQAASGTKTPLAGKQRITIEVDGGSASIVKVEAA